MMGAIKVYDELKKSNEDCEIAAVSGDSNGGLKADTKIRNQVAYLKNSLISKK